MRLIGRCATRPDDFGIGLVSIQHSNLILFESENTRERERERSKTEDPKSKRDLAWNEEVKEKIKTKRACYKTSHKCHNCQNSNSDKDTASQSGEDCAGLRRIKNRKVEGERERRENGRENEK